MIIKDFYLWTFKAFHWPRAFFITRIIVFARAEYRERWSYVVSSNVIHFRGQMKPSLLPLYPTLTSRTTSPSFGYISFSPFLKKKGKRSLKQSKDKRKNNIAWKRDRDRPVLEKFWNLIIQFTFHFWVFILCWFRVLTIFFKWAIPGLFFCLFWITIDRNAQINAFEKLCRCWDSNHGSLMSDGTALPTAPQPQLLVSAVFGDRVSANV